MKPVILSRNPRFAFGSQCSSQGVDGGVNPQQSGEI